MMLSCCAWVLPSPEHDILTQLSNVGFRAIDVRPDTFTLQVARAGIQNLGLSISCIASSFGLPEDVEIDSHKATYASEALAYIENTLSYARKLDVSIAYVIPGQDVSSKALARFGNALTSIADTAEKHGLKLCIEHFPGRNLPTAKNTLKFLKGVGHPNLYLLFDIGHALMSNENPVETIETAGDRLGYVHLDDNDGQNDLHLSLTDGVLTEDLLTQTFTALSDIGYDGNVSLELNPELPNPLEALKHSRKIIQNIAQII